jgi:2,3-bisphosphoglycerate-independent phosphoglycerate mutase
VYRRRYDIWFLGVTLSTFCSVHDGWGIAPETEKKGDAIRGGDTTNMDTLAKEHAHRPLSAHGVAVGLSEGLMGNSEVG